MFYYFRNHPRPGVSKVLLISHFYSHFGIDQSLIDEYDTDLMLEYDDTETYQHFRYVVLVKYICPIFIIVLATAILKLGESCGQWLSAWWFMRLTHSCASVRYFVRYRWLLAVVH
jgi:hypothetical protein